MPEATSPWRVNDVVTYDRMRDAATILIAQLNAAANADDPASEAARDELVRLHGEVAAVDAYHRAAVMELAERIELRTRELRDSSR